MKSRCRPAAGATGRHIADNHKSRDPRARISRTIERKRKNLSYRRRSSEAGDQRSVRQERDRSALAADARACEPPPLPARFLEPSGFIWGCFAAPDGAELRWGHLPAQAPRAECVMVGGFSECIEKYFETIGDLAALGLSVWCLDWRGQGGSERPRRLPSRPRPRRFDRDAVELALFTRTIPAAGWPRILIGHSMGGAIALLCLRRYPGSFDAAILSAPMLGIRTGGVPSPLVRGISSLARAAGLGMCFVPGAGAWQPDRVPSPERSRVSNDPERCRLQCAWFLEHAALRVDEPTWGWLDASLRLAARLARKEESTFRSCSPAQDWRLLYRPPPIAVPPGCYRTAPWSSCRLRSTNPFLS